MSGVNPKRCIRQVIQKAPQGGWQPRSRMPRRPDPTSASAKRLPPIRYSASHV